MATSRRSFLTTALLASASGVLLPRVAFGVGPTALPGAGKRLLILGGTGFLGPAVVEAAKALGWSVTLFNRGRTEQRKGIIEDVEKIYGNRDPDRRAVETDEKSPKGLERLEEAVKTGARWDAVLDNSGFFPRHVKASAELLAKATDRYIFISTISVYAANDVGNADESAAVGTIADPTVENMGAQGENYGPLKALCEGAAAGVFGDRALAIRPGFIVGPRDDTDRFTYWPVRAAAGGEMLVPGSPEHPMQFIDVRDLANFIMTAIGTKASGAVNATGPVVPDSKGQWGAVVAACLAAAKASGAEPAAPSAPVWVENSFLQARGVAIGADLPLYIPPEGEAAGFHTRSIKRAIELGLRTRSAQETAAAVLAWWPTELERRARVTKQLMDEAEKAGKPAPQMADPKVLRAGMNQTREAELLKAWRERK
jgi:2'-hydroxyisoflavone reductase